MTEPRATRRNPIGWGIVVWAIVACSWLLVIARAIPYRDGDRGVFASVAERLVAGDRLYVDVWDNKEPLFYWTLALGRTVSPYLDIAIELVWLAAAAVAVCAIAASFGAPRLIGLLVGASATPLILTGGAYLAGFTHLPGTALVLVMYALLLRGRLLPAGLLVPVIVGFKILALPVVVAVLAVAILRDRHARWSRLVVGAVAAGISLVALLAIRGELMGFGQLVRTNLTYSQSDLSDAYQWPVWRHLEPVLNQSSLVTVAAITLVLALTWGHLDSRLTGLWWTTCAAFVAALLVIALTGLWPHHGQILYGPAALSLVLLVTAMPSLRAVGVAAVVGIVAVTIVLSGGPSLRSYADALVSARTRWTDLSRIADATNDLRAVAPPGSSYARLGKNTEDTHAQGLRDYRLRCFQFLQYPYDPPGNLARIPQCLTDTDYVLVDRALATEPGQAAWNGFVEASESVLHEHFTCTEKQWGRLCANLDLPR